MKETIMRKLIVGLVLLSMVLSGCSTIQSLSSTTKTGAAIGAVTGGILGALIDSSNPWRGGVIGVAAGVAAGGWIGYKMGEKKSVAKADEDIVSRAAKEAATLNATVKYSRVTEAGDKEEVIATPGELKNNSRTIIIKYFRNDTLISTETRQIQV